MGFRLYMAAVDLLIPLMMILLGRQMLRRPPERINRLFGYRTAMSMKNPDTWAFAHRHCGRLWLRWGLILLPLSPLPLMLVPGNDPERLGTVGALVCLAQTVPLLLSVVLTELALRRTFHPDGRRKA